MEFSSFTFILTDSCNFNCSYCYQRKGTEFLDSSLVERALSFFLPYLSNDSNVQFTGGEPLLSFKQVKEAVNYIQEKNKTLNKKVHFSITTNGSLIDDNILNFLRHHKFTLVLSYDGLAQDVSRRKGTRKQLFRIIKRIIGDPGIKLEVNSVFSPETIRYLSRSIRLLIKLGVPEVSFALDKIPPWDPPSLNLLEKELGLLKELTLSSFNRTGAIVLSSFWKRYKKEIFSCAAGKDHLALAPDGRLWGCFLFPDVFKGKDGTQEYGKYCFGDLDSFIKDHEKIYAGVMTNYANLRMDKFYMDDKFCNDCPDIEECWTCPAEAAFSSTTIGEIPAWTCKIRKIMRTEKESFWRELKALVKR